jgi:hypothetical protein
MLEFNTWERIPQHSVTPMMRQKALRAHHIYDIKRDGSAKNRVVVNGSRQHTDTYDITGCLTATTTTTTGNYSIQEVLHNPDGPNKCISTCEYTGQGIYMYIPEGFPGVGEIALLVKAAYGTKQGARRFYDHTATVFEKIGLIQCPNEPCLHRYIDKTGECFVLTYVDDALITGTKETVGIIQERLKEHFKCKFNTPKDFLGLDVSIIAQGHVTLSMSTFTKRMSEALQIEKWKGSIATPGRTDMKILTTDDKLKDDSYRSKVGSLN